jgi:hypothetical protein
LSIIIIGAGPVGIFFTKLLLDKGIKVTLIESGGIRSESNLLKRDKYIFETESALPSGVHRVGGGSTKWRGRLSEFLDIDFCRISSTGDKVWPFNKNELVKHYSEVYKFLGLGSLTDKEIINRFFLNEAKNLPKDLFLRSFRYCKPDFFVELFESYKTDPNLTLITEHFCTEIQTESKSNKFSVNLISSSEENKRISVDKVVITCGALQTVALLQRSKRLLQQDCQKLLGVGLMEHAEGYIGNIVVKNRNEIEFFTKICNDFNNRVLDVMHGVGVAISLMNKEHDLSTQINSQFEIRNYMPKAYYFDKISKEIHNSVLLKAIWVFLFIEKILSYVLRKLNAVLDYIFSKKRFSIYLKAEELSHNESTVGVSRETPLVVKYHHRISEETYHLILKNIQEFSEVFEGYFQAKMRLYSGVKSIAQIKKFFGANWHPMGTTKLGIDPTKSICNEHLQVHGVPNLYLLSASVFPSGSNTNPTFTALALANRLSESLYFKEPTLNG